MKAKSGYPLILFAVVVLLSIGSALSVVTGAEISGAQSGRWTAAASPYIVTGEIVIPAGQTLTIEPGVVVKFAGYHGIKVQGTLVAAGGESARIIFTSVYDFDFDARYSSNAVSPSPRDWRGIEFFGAAQRSQLEHCVVRFSDKVIIAKFSKPALRNIIISDCGSPTFILNGALMPVQDGFAQDYEKTVPQIMESSPPPPPAPNEPLPIIDGALNAPEETPLQAEDELGEIDLGSFFDVHGFFDTEYEVDNRNADGRAGDFDVHHFNVISTFTFSERAFVLGEIEYEHGVEHSKGAGPGLVALERAWLQIKLARNESLNFLVGKYLTPYGIYNMIHDATPTFLFSKLPFSLYDSHTNASGKTERDYPKFLAGIQLNGLLRVASGKLEYYAYLANGKGANPFEKDDNTNKSVGFRLRYIGGLEKIKIGTSFFRGKNGSDAHSMQQLAAGDLELNLGKFKLQTEGTLNRFDRLKRDSTTTSPHRRALGFYAMGSFAVANRFYPFAVYDRYNPDIDAANDAETDISIGLNIGITKDIFFKMENHFRRGEAANYDPYELFITSIAAGF